MKLLILTTYDGMYGASGLYAITENHCERLVRMEDIYEMTCDCNVNNYLRPSNEKMMKFLTFLAQDYAVDIDVDMFIYTEDGDIPWTLNRTQLQAIRG